MRKTLDNNEIVNTIPTNKQTNNGVRIARCLFEQSGTFKKEFKKLGIEAYDYDILNEYGETDYQIDLFGEIQKAYDGGESIFDTFTPEDVIMAFFPCTRFECQAQMMFAGHQFQITNMSDEYKLEYDLKIHKELSELYDNLTKLTLVVIRKGLRMVIENPATQPHYLTNYWCMKPKIIDKDRRLNGDYCTKPTQYWFIGFEPEQNVVFEPLDYVEQRRIEKMKNQEKSRKTMRSEIHPQYASRFIRQYILKDGGTI